MVDADREFLAALYASTRDEELRAVDWSEEDKARFLRQQFEAQDRHYREHYPGASLDVICDAEAPVGRLYVYRTPAEVRLMDIALVPAYRGQGIGSRLVADLLAGAAAERQKVTLHVEPWNPAKRLYDRLGFRVLEERGAYVFMELPAP